MTTFKLIVKDRKTAWVTDEAGNGYSDPMPIRHACLLLEQLAEAVS
jgi:hypothetical protein